MGKPFQVSRIGEEHHNAKLTDDDVRYIRDVVWKRRRILARIMREFSDEAIAAEVGCSRSTVEKVYLRHTWTHVV